MALYVNTNSEAIIAQDNLTTTENALNTATTDLSSGLRINTAADDAAGYAISEDLTSQVNGLNQSTNNANDATSLICANKSHHSEQSKAFDKMSTRLASGDTSLLAEMHATTSGLKVLVSTMSVQDVETARRSMGGHGYSAFGGLGKVYAEHLPSTT